MVIMVALTCLYKAREVTPALIAKLAPTSVARVDQNQLKCGGNMIVQVMWELRTLINNYHIWTEFLK